MQNEEQSNVTAFWQRIRDTQTNDAFKPIDRLYIEYDRDQFVGLNVDVIQDPELFSFVDSIKNNTHKFDDYPKHQLEYFARRIYELRKDNRNNSAG